jgi:hypothetical protein
MCPYTAEEDDEQKDELEDDEDEEEDKQEEEAKNEKEDKDADDGKQPRTIGQEEMVNTSAYNVDPMVDDQGLVLHEQGQERCEHTSRPETPEPCT